MKDRILRFSAPVTLVGGGEIGSDDLALGLALAPQIVAVDSGAGDVLQAGHQPEAVIGDFDSISRAVLDQIAPERLFQIEEQDSTDFEKALSRVDAPFVLGIGFLGLRMDHQLAAFNALVKLTNRKCVLIGADEVIFHLTAPFQCSLEPGDTVSLFPILPVTGRSKGLVWPIDGLSLAPDGRIGTSNKAEGAVRIEVDGPGLLAILPRARLAQVIDGLL